MDWIKGAGSSGKATIPDYFVPTCLTNAFWFFLAFYLGALLYAHGIWLAETLSKDPFSVIVVDEQKTFFSNVSLASVEYISCYSTSSPSYLSIYLTSIFLFKSGIPESWQHPPQNAFWFRPFYFSFWVASLAVISTDISN